MKNDKKIFTLWVLLVLPAHSLWNPGILPGTDALICSDVKKRGAVRSSNFSPENQHVRIKEGDTFVIKVPSFRIAGEDTYNYFERERAEERAEEMCKRAEGTAERWFWSLESTTETVDERILEKTKGKAKTVVDCNASYHFGHDQADNM